MYDRYKQCQICGRSLDDPYLGTNGQVLYDSCLTREHILPRIFVRTVNYRTRLGNFCEELTADDKRNITYTCRWCNRRKSGHIRFPYRVGSGNYVLSENENLDIIKDYALYLFWYSPRIDWFYKHAMFYDKAGQMIRYEGYADWFRFYKMWLEGIRDFQ